MSVGFIGERYQSVWVFGMADWLRGSNVKMTLMPVTSVDLYSLL